MMKKLNKKNCSNVNTVKAYWAGGCSCWKKGVQASNVLKKVPKVG